MKNELNPYSIIPALCRIMPISRGRYAAGLWLPVRPPD